MHFLRLSQLEVKVRSNEVKSPNTKFSFRSMPILSSLPQDSKNEIYFDVQRLEMPKEIYLKKIAEIVRPYSETPALRSSSFPLQDVLTVRNRLVLKSLV